MAYTTDQFDAAVARIFGEKRALHFREQRLNRPQVCEIVAKERFIGKLADAEEADLAIVRFVAANLWDGAGETGLRIGVLASPNAPKA